MGVGLAGPARPGGGKSAAGGRVPPMPAGRRGRGRAAGSEAVMIWSRGEAIESGDAELYMELLGARIGGAGRRIAARCERVWPHYGEVVRNRKACIKGLAMRCLRGGRTRQVVILGAGLDPLSVEIAALTGYSAVSYEIDATGARRKRRLMEEASAAAAGCVRHVTADLEEAGPGRITSALERRGWRADMPTLVVAEGVSYYLRKPTLRGLLAPFRAGGDGAEPSRAILEYLRDAASIAPEGARIADAVFGIFAEGTGIGGLSRYTDAEAAALVAGLPARRPGAGEAARRAGGIATVGPAEMERARTRRNRLFPDDSAGWIAVCHGRLPPAGRGGKAARRR